MTHSRSSNHVLAQNAQPGRPRWALTTAVAVASMPALVGCVSSGTHQKVLDSLAQSQKDLSREVAARDAFKTKAEECDANLATALDQNSTLAAKVTEMGQDVEQLLGEKGQLAQERERLASELAQEAAELARMRAAAEARNAEYRTVVEKLKKMVDAGKLAVRIRKGRMVVEMASDVVFPPGGTEIKSEAKEAITELARAMTSMDGRQFQVVGHSDSTPIKTPRFPSNWELSSQRAIEVVRLLVKEGVPPTMLSAAGNAEFDPLVDGNDAAAKAQNRRVEIIFMPKLDELPGFGDLASTR